VLVFGTQTQDRVTAPAPRVGRGTHIAASLEAAAVGATCFGKTSFVKQTGEPLTKWARRFWAGLLLLWLLLAIGWVVRGHHPFQLALSLTWVVAASVNLWRDWSHRRSADRPALPER